MLLQHNQNHNVKFRGFWIILLILFSFSFIACPSQNKNEEESPDTEEQKKDEEEDDGKDPNYLTDIKINFTDSEKETIKKINSDSKTATFDECYNGLNTILKLLSEHKDEEGASSYIKIAQDIYQILSTNKTAFSEVTQALPEKTEIPSEPGASLPEGFSEFFTAEDGTEMFYGNYQQYMDAYNKVIECFNNVKTAFTTYDENFKSYEAAISSYSNAKAIVYVCTLISDFKSDYDIDGNYSKDALQQYADESKAQIDKIASERQKYLDSEATLKNLLKEYNDSIYEFNHLSLVSYDISRYQSDEPEENQNNEEAENQE